MTGLFFTLALPVLGALATPQLDDPLRPSLRATDIWVVKVQGVTWNDKAVENRRRGKLALQIVRQYRGKTSPPDENFTLPVWENDPPGVFDDGGSPWHFLKLEKGESFVVFLAPKPRDYDIWDSPIGKLRVIDVQPATPDFILDLLTIEKVFRDETEETLLKTLKDPKAHGDELVAFAAEWAFRHNRLGSPGRRTLLELAASDKFSPVQKYNVLLALNSGYLVRLDGKFPDEVQVLAVMLAAYLTDKATRERGGNSAVSFMYDLLVAGKRQRDVKFEAAEFPPLIAAVRAVDHQHSKPLIEVLEKMARAAK
ncbi:hypothetical protein AYO44_09995 [Planctomycetaceae bacterium SCGC AG-212-F19]|nr:hypothetical protein AYO44_09995 [Planctomycetaceae bacterium SCGC AG-212-F19]